MNYIKSYYQLFESITNISIVGWNIKFNHGPNHDLDDKLSKRVNISENDFRLFIDKVISHCEKDKINGDWIFISIIIGIKLVVNINYNSKVFYIVTILGKNEKTKHQKNIKLI